MKNKLVFGWYGGKYSHLNDIVPHFPRDSVHFVDVFGGSAAVILNAGDYKLKTYNDIDGEVVNFFRQLRNNSERLIEIISLTPYSREEMIESQKRTFDDLERARRFYVRTVQAFSNIQKNPQWSRTPKIGENKPRKWLNKIEKLPTIVEELIHIQIENRDALKLIHEFDAETTFFYCDPPYVLDTRSGGKGYVNEMTNEDHRKLADILNKCSAKIMVSGYKGDLYDEIFKDWKRIDFKEKVARSTIRRGKGYCSKRQESIWINYEETNLTKYIT